VRRTTYSIIISFISHSLLFLAVGMYFVFPQTSIIIGDQESPFIHSYFYQENFSKDITKASTQASSSTSSEKTIPEAIPLLPKKMLTKKEKTVPIEKKVSEAVARNIPAGKRARGQETEELLARLHAAIQQQQQYPVNAQQMNRQGRATITFTLYKNGQVSHVSLVKSSGTESLDEAALAAVRDAAPFQQIEKYLQDKKEFSIDVVFELA
jgi:TonB family protein